MRKIIETIVREDGSALVEIEYTEMTANEIIEDMIFRLTKICTIFMIVPTINDKYVVTFDVLESSDITRIFGDCEI